MLLRVFSKVCLVGFVEDWQIVVGDIDEFDVETSVGDSCVVEPLGDGRTNPT